MEILAYWISLYPLLSYLFTTLYSTLLFSYFLFAFFLFSFFLVCVIVLSCPFLPRTQNNDADIGGLHLLFHFFSFSWLPHNLGIELVEQRHSAIIILLIYETHV